MQAARVMHCLTFSIFMNASSLNLMINKDGAHVLDLQQCAQALSSICVVHVLKQEDWIGQGLHHDVQLFYKIHSDVLTAAQITYDDVVHAMGLVSC